MKCEAKHAPLPWSIGESCRTSIDIDANVDGVVTVWIKNGMTKQAHANADFIVKAVNCHADMLEALDRVMGTDAVEADDRNKGEGTVYDDARAAIAKAKGQA